MKNVDLCSENNHEWQLNGLREKGEGVEQHLNGDDKFFHWGYTAWFGCKKCYAKSKRTLTADEYEELLPQTVGFHERAEENYPHDFVRPK